MAGIALVDTDPPPLCSQIRAEDLMAQPVVTLPKKVTVESVRGILKNTTHNKYPIVVMHSWCFCLLLNIFYFRVRFEVDFEKKFKFNLNRFSWQTAAGTLEGAITRSVLITMIKHKIFDGSDFYEAEAASLLAKEFPSKLNVKVLKP